jgi:hypothetical protein
MTLHPYVLYEGLNPLLEPGVCQWVIL